jgi:hypothetical protein
MGLEFLPSQMTIDLSRLQPDALNEATREPAGAPTVIALTPEDSAPLYN